MKGGKDIQTLDQNVVIETQQGRKLRECVRV